MAEEEIIATNLLELLDLVLALVGVPDLRLLQRLMEIQDPEPVVVVALSMDQVVLVQQMCHRRTVQQRLLRRHTFQHPDS